jgi:G3E family GTPase
MSVLPPIPLTVLAGDDETHGLVPQILQDRHSVVTIVAPADWCEARSSQMRHTTSSVLAGSRVSVRPVIADIASRTHGCSCCRVRIDVVEALCEIARRRHRPDHVVLLVPRISASSNRSIEAVAADVPTVVYTILGDPDVSRLYRLDGVLATIDAVTAVTRLRAELPFADTIEVERLAIADRILVARADQVVDESFRELVDTLRMINRCARLLAPTIERVGVEDLVGIDAWHGVPVVAPAPPPRRVRLERETAVAETIVLHQHGLLDSGGVEEWLEDVIARHASRLIRMQGVLAVDGSPSRMCCHGVRSHAMSHPEHDHPPQRRSESSLMVLVGYGLPAEELAETLSQTAIR